MEPNDASQSKSPKNRLLILFGPSQFGKSSFINTLLDYSNSNSERAPVGTGSGESVTPHVISYNIGSVPVMFPLDRCDYDTISLIDVPGFYDSNLRVSNEEILQQIKGKVASSGNTQIDALLVFESMQADARKINITMRQAYQLFGKSIMDSTIVVTTKWDRVYPEETAKVTRILEAILKNLNLDYVRWENNYRNNSVHFLELESQVSRLGSMIEGLQPYQVFDFTEFIRYRDDKAREIQARDPNRYANKEEEVEINEPEEYTEEVPTTVTEWVPYTEEEITKKAQELHASSTGIKTGLRQRPTGRTKEVTKVIGYRPVPKEYEHVRHGRWGPRVRKYMVTNYEPIITQEQEEELEWVEGDMVKMPIEFFRAMLRGQMYPRALVKNITINKVRMIKSTKVVKVEHERFDFEYYQKIALSEIEQEFRNNIRVNI